jgi:predicted nuclease of predicted toxin-antitoxin system
VAGRFPLLFDACVRQQIVDGMIRRNWDVQRAVDLFPERTDPILFEYAASASRVFVTNDEEIQRTAESWLREGRPFAGLMFWP